jgi:hypothetical protein
MRPILGFAALLAWLSHCPDISHPDHHHDAGQPTEDAGPDVTCETDDASVPRNDAAVGGGDAGTPPVIEDASVGTEDLDATMIDPPDGSIVDEPKTPVIVPPGQCITTGLGLYEPGYCDEQHLAPGIKRYVPRYPLWSDAAVKDRYILLPKDKFIDTSNPDRWTFPIGTTLWKMFTVNGTRVETRRLEKTSDAPGMGGWDASVYIWTLEQNKAVIWTDIQKMSGQADAVGTHHNVPSSADCATCHSFKVPGPMGTIVDGDIVNGFGAIQLNWEKPLVEPGRPPAITLDNLVFDGVLRNGPAGLANVKAKKSNIPGDSYAQEAIGYLHANCGHCHGGESPKGGLKLWALTNKENVSDMFVVQQGCGKCLARWFGKAVVDDPTEVYKYRILPGDSHLSGIVGRMSYHMAGDATKRDVANQMPKIGTELVDFTGLAKVEAWIDRMQPGECGVLPPVCDAPLPPPMAAAAGAGGAGGAGGAAGAAGTPPTTP